jgi:hypothetical protein
MLSFALVEINQDPISLFGRDGAPQVDHAEAGRWGWPPPCPQQIRDESVIAQVICGKRAFRRPRQVDGMMTSRKSAASARLILMRQVFHEIVDLEFKGLGLLKATGPMQDGQAISAVLLQVLEQSPFGKRSTSYVHPLRRHASYLTHITLEASPKLGSAVFAVELLRCSLEALAALATVPSFGAAAFASRLQPIQKLVELVPDPQSLTSLAKLVQLGDCREQNSLILAPIGFAASVEKLLSIVVPKWSRSVGSSCHMGSDRSPAASALARCVAPRRGDSAKSGMQSGRMVRRHRTAPGRTARGAFERRFRRPPERGLSD